MTPDEAQQIRADMHRIENEVAGLSALIKTEGLRCPYRETIARSSNNRRQIEKNTADIERLEERVHTIDISVAKLMLLMTGSGGLGGALVALINYLIARGGV